jgi:hypothetical protein
MIRITFEERPVGTTMRIMGRLVSHFAEQTKELVLRGKIPADLIVDVSELTFADGKGEEALTWLGRLGAEFIADSSYSSDLCERLHLRLSMEVTPDVSYQPGD